MSRIERALEKALHMRRPLSEPGRSAIGLTTYSKCDPSVFEVGAAGVDPAAVNRHLVSITDPDSTAGEEYRKLRAKILRATEANYLNAIMVTSSQAGEGKTMTAINLAVSIAREIDHTVLLVDADLRRSSIHTYLGIHPQAGLSDYLESRAELSDVLIKTGIGKLVLLPAGKPPKNPSELISSERMRTLVRELKFRYRDRYIIIDSSPLLMTADALSLCQYTDGIIFVVQADRTSVTTATQAASLLKGHNVLGTVFNDVPKYLAKNLYPYYYHSTYAATVKPADAAENAADDGISTSANTDGGPASSAEAAHAADVEESSGESAESTSAGTDDGPASAGEAVKPAGVAASRADEAGSTSANRDNGNNGTSPENA
jgi:receptor protein-tyrosine kinase/non-specific protein-tyrosine kinase